MSIYHALGYCLCYRDISTRNTKHQREQSLINHKTSAQVTMRDCFDLGICRNRYFEVVKLLIKNHANVNAALNDEHTALMMSVEYDEIAKLSIQNGADINASCHGGRTVLVFASENGNLDLYTN